MKHNLEDRCHDGTVLEHRNVEEDALQSVGTSGEGK